MMHFSTDEAPASSVLKNKRFFIQCLPAVRWRGLQIRASETAPSSAAFAMPPNNTGKKVLFTMDSCLRRNDGKGNCQFSIVNYPLFFDMLVYTLINYELRGWAEHKG